MSADEASRIMALVSFVYIYIEIWAVSKLIDQKTEGGHNNLYV